MKRPIEEVKFEDVQYLSLRHQDLLGSPCRRVWFVVAVLKEGGKATSGELDFQAARDLMDRFSSPSSAPAPSEEAPLEPDESSLEE